MYRVLIPFSLLLVLAGCNNYSDDRQPKADPSPTTNIEPVENPNGARFLGEEDPKGDNAKEK